MKSLLMIAAMLTATTSSASACWFPGKRIVAGACKVVKKIRTNKPVRTMMAKRFSRSCR